MNNKCVFCGVEIPEGRQVCPNCETNTIMKEKQIEEMAKRIHIATDLYYIECIKIATYLFEKDNCRIIDKDSVVLSQENYDKLCHLAYFGYDDYYAKGSKETAEKILKWLKKSCAFFGFEYVEAYFKEQFGVELGGDPK